MTEPVLITRADVAPRGSSEILVKRPEGAWCETGETSVAVEPESVCEERETRTNKRWCIVKKHPEDRVVKL